jgi:heme iron utilization protein
MTDPTPTRELTPPPDAEAMALTRGLLGMRHAALAWTDPATGTPGISRIAFGIGVSGVPMTLISALTPHFAALKASPPCAILLGEPGPKGDPLTHPRLMIRANARLLERPSEEHAAARAHWLKEHPKSALYIDFEDFALVELLPQSALLNGGFGKAFRLTAGDITAAMP